MAKNTEIKNDKIEPQITQSPKLTADAVPSFHLPENYLVEMPDGSLASVTPNTFRRAFQDRTDIKVKKSPNQ